jgi:hypothetical protein
MPQSGVVLFAQLASLAGTGWIVWSVARAARPHPHSLAGMVIQAGAYALLAFICSGALMTAFQVMTAFQLASARSLGLDALRIPLGTARTSVWLAPTAILLSRSSPAAVGAVLALAIGITQLLYSQWSELESVALPPAARSETWLRVSGFAVALGGQAVVVAFWMGAPRLAAALLCLSAASLTLLCLIGDAYRAREPSNMPDSLMRILFTLILAAGLTVGGGMAGLDSGSESSAEADAKTRPGPDELVTALYQPSPGSTGSIEVTDKSYQCVILWPKVRETQRLVAPSRTALLSPLPPVAARTPLRIPFSGQYWMFKPPLTAPPRGSYFRESSPLDLAFFTTDQRPMSMKALQKLEHALDLGCCRAIQIAISNADRYPGTVALELLLIDTQAPGQLVQSLGKRDVLSRPNVKGLDLAVIPVTEVLEFPVSGSTRMRQFDGIQVLFHRAPFRIDRSARISIEDFILVPP